MNRTGYIRIMSALVHLMVVIMVEAGKVPLNNATKVGENIMKALTGGTGENKQK
jgi:hypothetical protein